MKRFVILAVLVFMTSSSFAQDTQMVECGDIIEKEFTEDHQPYYYEIELGAGSQLRVTGSVIGDTLGFTIAIYAPNGDVIAVDGRGNFGNSYPQPDPQAITGVVSANGTYKFVAHNSLINNGSGGLGGKSNTSGGIGVFNLYIGCTLRDGTVIEPGDNVPPPDDSGSGTQTTSQPVFSGFGFPGILPVDFSTGIEIPIQAGQPQTAPIGGDIVALYTYDATVNSTATLSLSRVSGDISIGVTVIKKDSNEIVFVGGMPSSNNLSVELTFPSDGTYVIGLFQMKTAEHSETSGAVQVSIG